MTPTDGDEDEPLFGVLSGWVLLGGVAAAPVAERFGSLVGGVVTAGGPPTRGVTWIVRGVVELACRAVCAGAEALNAAQPRTSASALTSTGLAGRHIFFSHRGRSDDSLLHKNGDNAVTCATQACAISHRKITPRGPAY